MKVNRLIIILFLLAFLLSGCSSDYLYSKTEFCLSEGYYVGNAQQNWEWSNIHNIDGDFNCVDLKNRNVSDIYSEEDLLK